MRRQPLRSALESSEEHGTHQGLGVFPGRVVRFRTDLHVPHVGWNLVEHREHPLFQGLGAAPHAYFVHSYHPVEVPDEVAIAQSDYDGRFVCGAARDSAAGLQFHPEKSGPEGLAMLERFTRWRP